MILPVFQAAIIVPSQSDEFLITASTWSAGGDGLARVTLTLTHCRSGLCTTAKQHTVRNPAPNTTQIRFFCVIFVCRCEFLNLTRVLIFSGHIFRFEENPISARNKRIEAPPKYL